MVRYRLLVAEEAEASRFPLHFIDLSLEMELDFGSVDVPEQAQRRIAAEALQRIVDDLDGTEFDTAGQWTAPPPRSRPDASAAPALFHEEVPDEWVKPAGIDLRILKSAHKVIKEVAKRGESGKAVLASELVQDGLVSAPTMSRLLKGDEVAGQYLAPYVMVSNAGRTKALDLTPKGRLLASKIRAGVVPD